jgi:DNA-binding transcriptional regulator YdaS (Cro superfamily)
MDKVDKGFERVLAAVKSRSALATALGINRQAVSLWGRVPAERVMAVEALTGIPRSVIRPDIYPPEREPGASDEKIKARIAELEVRLRRPPRGKK